jgi:hypothetical protein
MSKIIWVRRQWFEPNSGCVAFSKLSYVHWADVHVSDNSTEPRFFLHGLVWSNEISQPGAKRGWAQFSPPQRIKVCVCRQDNDPAIFVMLLGMAGCRPDESKRNGRRQQESTILNTCVTFDKWPAKGKIMQGR